MHCGVTLERLFDIKNASLCFSVGSGCVKGAKQTVSDSYDTRDLKGMSGVITRTYSKYTTDVASAIGKVL